MTIVAATGNNVYRFSPENVSLLRNGEQLLKSFWLSSWRLSIL